MAGLGEQGTFKLDSSTHSVGAVAGGTNIDALLDRMGDRQKGQSFKMDPKTTELGTSRNPQEINALLDTAAQRGRGAEGQGTHKLDPKTHTVAATADPKVIDGVLDAKAAGKAVDTRLAAVEIHETEQIERAGERAGQGHLTAQTLASAQGAIKGLADAMKGKGSHAANVDASRGKGLER